MSRRRHDPVATAWANLRLEARRRWGRANPHRLGRLVGECIVQLPNPYPTTSRAHAEFEGGVRISMRAEARPS